MTTTTPTTAPTTAETVARSLANHPDGITVRDLATEAGIGASTAAKALATMETTGTATRTSGPANGNRKSADIWHPVADDAAAPADEAPVADDAAAPADEAPVADDAAAPADEAPAPAAPRQPDLKVLIMAGVLGDHPDGVSAAVAIAESGLAPATGDTILAAMEVAGAARRLPVGDDGEELWVRGVGDLATVDPANAPTHVTCPTCGHTRRVRRPSATGRRTGGTGRATGDINSDGSPKLGKNGLRNLVEAFMRDLGPGHDVTPGTAGRELGGRSSGACLNAMNALTGLGVLVMTNPAPVHFALVDNPPAPSPEVAALMTRPAAAPASDGDGDTSDAPASDGDGDTSDAPASDGDTTDAPAADEALAA